MRYKDENEIEEEDSGRTSSELRAMENHIPEESAVEGPDAD